MQTHQAIIFTCSEAILKDNLKSFVENDLNLYAVDYLDNPNGMKVLLDDTEARNEAFQNFQNYFTVHNIPRIIIFSHIGCLDLSELSFDSTEEEARERELKLRHAVSVTQSKYPDKQVEAYLALMDDHDQISFKKVI
ncbi:MAG: hypothetical protein KW788_00405 [Candidatus Doudnabacteria bacterium]|nr:hypothetical protein [Candidatus Doudnabacteria bacterium]